MMIMRMRKDLLFLIILLTVIASQLSSCGYDSQISTPVTNSFSLSGQVTSGSSGLAGVTIALSGASQGASISDTIGNYTFSGLANGSYTVTPSASGFTFNPINRVRIVNGANIPEVNFSAIAAVKVQLVACPAGGKTNVLIQDYFFSPILITIDVNSVVKWTNSGPSPHTVTSVVAPSLEGYFNSGPIGAEPVCYQFLAIDTYRYICSINPEMSGSVIVQ